MRWSGELTTVGAALVGATARLVMFTAVLLAIDVEFVGYTVEMAAGSDEVAEVEVEKGAAVVVAAEAVESTQCSQTR